MTTDERVQQLTDALAAEIRRREQVEAENATLRAQINTGGSPTTADLVIENARLTARVADLTERMEVMLARVALMTRRIYGRGQRQHHPDQQVLDEIMRQILVETALRPDESVASPAADTTTTGQGPAAGSAASLATAGASVPRPPRAKRRSRLAFPADMPTEDVLLSVPESERLDADGKPLPQVGMEVRTKLDFVPPGFRVLRFLHPIYQKPFQDGTRVVAPPVPCIVPKGLPTDRTVALVLVEKYDFHNPLFRQETRLERAGLAITRATLMNWVRHGAEALAPIHQAIGDSIRQSPVIGMDDTWLRTLDPGAGKTHQSRLWGYFADDEFFCEYRRTREGRWPAEFLAAYRGVVMADAYSGHHRLFTDGLRKAAGCMAHAMRKFEDALELGESLARQALDLFSLLYRIEQEVAGQPPDLRKARRQTEAIPVLDRLEALIMRWEAEQRRSSRLFVAAQYTRKIFPQLRTYTTDGRIPIDNNDLERMWRQPSLNRKNSLFVGSDRGGDWAATMFSICQCCRLVGIDPYRYICEIFAELHTGRKDYANLRPKAWAGRLVARSA